MTWQAKMEVTVEIQAFGSVWCQTPSSLDSRGSKVRDCFGLQGRTPEKEKSQKRNVRDKEKKFRLSDSTSRSHFLHQDWLFSGNSKGPGTHSGTCHRGRKVSAPYSNTSAYQVSSMYIQFITRLSIQPLFKDFALKSVCCLDSQSHAKKGMRMVGILKG